MMEVTDLGASPSKSKQGKSTSSAGDDRGWEAEYFAYLAEKEAAQKVADEASSSSTPEKMDKEQPPAEESWEAQYAAYCAEKEAKLAEDDAKRLQEAKQQRSNL